jgi:hypothetical protein
MPNSNAPNISYHDAYRFHTWDEPRIYGFTYKRQPEGGWIAIIDGTEIEVLGVLRREVVEEAVRQARLPATERPGHTLTTKPS